jgi:hypothetical protein
VGYPDLSVDVILRKHIPALLPIKGKRVKIVYAGIPAFCNKCWKLGHAHWECKEPNKTNWLEFVADLYINDNVTEEMLGSWVPSLYKYHPSLGGVPKNGTTAEFVGKNKDLRHLLTEKKQPQNDQNTAQSNQQNNQDLRALLEDLRNQISNRGRGPQETNRGRGRGSTDRGRGRGKDRGRGRGRGRGQNTELLAGLAKLLNK